MTDYSGKRVKGSWARYVDPDCLEDPTGADLVHLETKRIQWETAESDDGEANHPKHTIKGMMCVALGTALICTVGAAVKGHGGSVLQLMEGRYLVQFMLAMLWWSTSRPARVTSWAGDEGYRLNIWLRGAIYFLLIFSWWRALELVPIGDAEAFLFLSPLLTIFSAKILLNEPLPKFFGLTSLVTIAGVIFICQPPFIFGGNQYIPITLEGFLFLSVCCISWTTISLLLRTARHGAHWLQIEIVSSAQAVWIWTPLLMFITRVFGTTSFAGGPWDFSARSFLLMLVVGVIGFAGLCLNVVGYQIGDATKVAWMEYLDLVFAFMYQCLVFKEMPNKWEIAGASLLMSTCAIRVLEETLTWRAKLQYGQTGNEHEPLLKKKQKKVPAY